MAQWQPLGPVVTSCSRWRDAAVTIAGKVGVMCGISGEIRFDGRPPRIAAVAAMRDELAPRGPDGSGLWASDRVAFGHRRLAIIDLSRAGEQPMVDPALGLSIVFNGCIYNHQQLHQELAAAGYQFFSTSDTEVLLKAYHHWGEQFVDHLVGMFALAIHERDSGRVVLARDRLGIKPLYLAEVPGALRFASSLPAIVKGGDIDTAIDPVALHHYLTFHAIVPEPRTMLAGVTKLPPATLLVIEPDGRRREVRYWSVAQRRDDAELAALSPDEWQTAIDDALRLAVERRMVADVPVGVLLSGGLDSSLIVGLLAEQGQHGLQTFSIGFDAAGDEEGDEFRWSDIVAERFDTDHHRMRVSTDRIIDALPGAVAAMSEPMVSHDLVAFYLLSEEVSRHVKVVQSGQGADEVFAGYHWYQTLSTVTGDGVDDYGRVFCDRTPAEIAEVVSARFHLTGDVAQAFVREQFDASGTDSVVERALRLDTEVMLTEDPVKRVDNTTMAWGLEARVPFLDHELVELAFACPTELKLAEGGKGVLKQLARSVIPAEVIDRKKGYFPVPPLVHLDPRVVDTLRDALLSPKAKARDLFQPEHVRHVLDHPLELTTLRYNKLWTLGILELWLQTHGI
jgi:asparagine synthase (glutamine-hydrolysing)